MKKFICLFIVFLSCCTCVMGQRTVYVKLSGNKAFYKVVNAKKRNSTNVYFSRIYDNKKDISDFEYAANIINEKTYNEVLEEEKLLSDISSVYGDKSQVLIPPVLNNDNRDIIARTYKGLTFTTSSDLMEGACYTLLEVEKAKDASLIGCPITCQVLERRKSNITGSEGRLIVKPIYITKQDGTSVRVLPSNIIKRGLNRSNVKFWTSIFIIPMFIPGTGAILSPEERFGLRVE